VNAEELCSRLAIQDLTNRYALYVDTKQLDRLIDLFWAEAIFDESALAAGPFSGQTATRQYFKAALPSVSELGGQGSFNFVLRRKGSNRDYAAPEGLLSRDLSAEIWTMEISITDAEITVSGSLSIRRSRRITYTAICNDASIVRRRIHGDAHLKNFAILY
jgi:hypothetical protein